MSDYLAKTVTKQFSNSPVLLALLEDFDQWVNMSKFTDDFLTNVWDISTAVGFGLDIWGRILGRSRNISAEQVPGNNFGFNINGAAGTPWQAFGQAPFFNGAASGVVSYPLADSYYRQLLLVKAAANIANCDCPSLNYLLRAMFGDRGKCYVGYDPNNPMHIGYHFEFMPTVIEQAIIESDLFPVPAGMSVEYIYSTLSYAPFGFAGANTGANPRAVTGFNQNPFYSP